MDVGNLASFHFLISFRGTSVELGFYFNIFT